MASSKTPDALAQHQGPPALGPPASPPAVAPTPHRGWHSRGYLPHCDQPGLFQHIVFGLADALPPTARPNSTTQADDLLDRCHGACVLRDSGCAALLENTILYADGERYRLIAWCIMPNHAHVIAEQIDGFPLSNIVQGWKSTSAHLINQHMDRRGRFWRREYFDRFMRDNDHLSTTIAYVENNPVMARLAQTATSWRWSSAWRREAAGGDAGGPKAAP